MGTGGINQRDTKASLLTSVPFASPSPVTQPNPTHHPSPSLPLMLGAAPSSMPSSRQSAPGEGHQPSQVETGNGIPLVDWQEKGLMSLQGGSQLAVRGSVPISRNVFSSNHNRVLRALDLFSGTGSVGAQLSKWGFQVKSLDKDPKCKADICLDILSWDYKRAHPTGWFQVICASVPCEEYSSAKTVQARNLDKADLLVRKVLEIVDYFRPHLWWIENPRNGLLRHRTFMQGLPFVDVDYCQFSEWGYRKPTRVWGSQQLGLLSNVLCDFKNCINIGEDDNGNYRHRERLGGLGQIYSTRDKGRVPSTLVDFLLKSTYRRDNNGTRKLPKWKGVGPVRVQSVEANKKDSLSLDEQYEGCSDDDDDNEHQEISLEREKKVMPENVLVLPKRMCRNRSCYAVNSLQRKEKELMLTLVLRVCSPGGRQKFIRALVDTGAQVNLIKKGLFPGGDFVEAESPLRLIAANGQVLEGGRRTISLRMKWYQSSDEEEVTPEIEMPGEFFEAEIGIDAILSYPWCRKNKLAVVPHLKCLAKVQPNLVLFRGEKKSLPNMVHSVGINSVQAGKENSITGLRLQRWVFNQAARYFGRRPGLMYLRQIAAINAQFGGDLVRHVKTLFNKIGIATKFYG